MPLFRSSRPDPVVDEPVVDNTPARHGSIFSSRRRAVSPAADPVVNNSTAASRNSVDSPRSTGGFFGRRRRTSADDISDASSGVGRNGTVNGATTTAGAGTGFFGRGGFKDAGLDAARGKVRLAEQAEKEADGALLAARRAVVEARRHVEILENEANEQARFAQQKVLAVRGVKNDAGHLGRHN